MLRNRFLSVTDRFELLGFPVRLFGLWDTTGAPGGGGSSSPSGSSPAGSGSPASAPAGGAASGTTPPGSSVAPGVEPPPGAPGSTAPAELDFQSIFDGPPTEVVEPVTPPAPTIPVTPAVPAAAAPVVPVEVPPVVPGAVAPAGTGDGGQQPAATPQPSGPVLDPYDPAGLATAIVQNEQAAIDHVASTLFQLSQEDLQALETDVGQAVPKLLAKAFVKTQINSMMQLARIIPEMVRRSMGDMKNHTQNEDAFYSKWPQINRQDHGDLVRRYGITYRQMNPNVKRDQMIEELGPLVMMAARIPVTAPVPGAAPVATNGTTPIARPAHQPTPFSPAIPGPAASVQPVELSAVEAMFQPQE